MIDTFIDTVLLFFLCLSFPSSVPLTCLITEPVYLDDGLGVISLVYCRGVGSITPGLGRKVFAQLLFYLFKLGSILRAADCEDLAPVSLGAGVHSVAAGRLSR